jgi:phosphatidylglycerol:prolipoprotein diacylglycerol transferase
MNGFESWWQHLPEKMHPEIFRIGSFGIHYYGLMYILAFVSAYLLSSIRIKEERYSRLKLNSETLQGYFIALIVGLIIGARFGYVFFYNFSYYIHRPLEIILPFSFEGGFHFTGIAGMSYHGGLIGAITGAYVFTRKHKLDFWEMSDILMPGLPLGYTFGRIGNFINGELYGRVTDSSVGMYFPYAPGNELRHPSQLYEAFFEGIVLFLFMWFIRKKITLKGAMLPVYMIGYGVIRFFIEFFRQPDEQLGFVLFNFSMGQILCFLMILSGTLMLVWLSKRKK